MKTLTILTIFILISSCTNHNQVEPEQLTIDTTSIMPHTLINQYQYDYIRSKNKDSIGNIVSELFKDTDETLLFAEGKINKMQWDFIKKCKQIK